MSRRSPSLLASLVAVSLAACGGSSAPPSSSPAGDKATAKKTEPKEATSSEPEAAVPDAPKPSAPPEPPVEIAVADARPAPAAVPTVAIASPTAEQVVPAAKLATTMVKLRTSGAAKVCVSIDGKPCVDVADPSKPMPLSELGALDKGQHVLVVVARDDAGEVVRAGKKKGGYAIVSFHVDKREKPAWKAGDPMLVPVLPASSAQGGDRTIDFLLANAEAAAGKYMIQLAISGPGISRADTSDDGRPFKLKGARRGTYTVRLALARYSPELGESGTTTTVRYTTKTMTGPYVDSTRTFKVE